MTDEDRESVTTLAQISHQFRLNFSMQLRHNTGIP